jgi:hypothetical protein
VLGRSDGSHVEALAANVKVGVPCGHKGAVKLVHEGLIGVTVAAAQLVVEVSENEWNRWRVAQSKQSAEQGKAVGSAGDGDYHPRLFDPKPAQTALDLDDQRRRGAHGGSPIS